MHPCAFISTLTHMSKLTICHTHAAPPTLQLSTMLWKHRILCIASTTFGAFWRPGLAAQDKVQLPLHDPILARVFVVPTQSACFTILEVSSLGTTVINISQICCDLEKTAGRSVMHKVDGKKIKINPQNDYQSHCTTEVVLHISFFFFFNVIFVVIVIATLLCST